MFHRVYGQAADDAGFENANWSKRRGDAGCICAAGTTGIAPRGIPLGNCVSGGYALAKYIPIVN